MDPVTETFTQANSGNESVKMATINMRTFVWIFIRPNISVSFFKTLAANMYCLMISEISNLMK